MNSQRSNQWLFSATALLMAASFFLSIAQAKAEPNIILWDTRSPLSDRVDPGQKDDWKIVPNDLFKLEADPLKSSSDPGYYGREYSFAGDMVVENRRIAAVFPSGQGKVLIYAKGPDGQTPSPQSPLGSRIAEITPFRSDKATIRKINLLRNAGDEVVAEVYFASSGSADLPAVFSFSKTEIVEVQPREPLQGINIRAPFDYAVVPSFVGDDLIFGPTEGAETGSLALPAENLLLGLLKGEQHQLVVTWPKGQQRVNFSLGQEKDGKRPISSFDLQTDGKSAFLAFQSAPGIWHREELNASYLEKKVASQWKRPFPAKWQTQLSEAGIPARYTFRDSASTVWRGVPGSYNYPVWFDNDTAFYHLSKKVPPKGESIIYFLEGHETPLSTLTPVDILKNTLGRSETEQILDLPGRKLRTHHRRGGTGVRRACTCGCTEAIQAIFEAREETTRKEDIREDIEDMIYFVQGHVQRIDEYRHFASEMIKFLEAKAKSSPELKPYLEEVQPIVEQIPQEYEVQKENMKSLDYAAELARRTMRLTDKNESGNLAAYMDLLKAWRGMGGAQDYVVAQCHTLTRKLFQQASYATASQPKALEVALEIRNRCRQLLRNADGYEIWPNY